MVQWRDLDIDLEKGVDGDVKAQTDIDAVKNSLRNIFQTFQGSRRMLPEFALNIYQLLFEPIDKYTGQLIAERFIDAIEVWDDRIEIDNIFIEADPDNSLYRIKLRFTLKSSNEIETLELILRAA